MEKQLVDRRSFLGVSAAAAGIAATASLGIGASHATADEITGATWLGEEPQIEDSDITQTIDTEVVICGAGSGGCFAAASIAEAGIQTIVIEKNAFVGTVRDDIGAINSSLQQAEGVEFDKAEVIRQHVMYCAGWVDQQLAKIWMEESGEAVDWYAGVLEQSGKAVMRFEGGYDAEIKAGSYTKFPTGHSPEWADGVRAGGDVLLAHAQDNGAQVMFETSLVKLEYDGTKVTGIIASGTDGYIRINASKGVVVATGGYSANPEMMEALQPDSLSTLAPIMEGANFGDGIKACLWMGADMDKTHVSMMFDRGAFLPTETPTTSSGGMFSVIGSQPFMKVNLFGKRFINESCPYDFTLHASSMQPGGCCVEVWDANYMEDIDRFSTMGCSRIYPFPNGAPANNTPEGLEEMIANLVEQGYVQQADTIEELAEKLNIPVDTFVSTCKRYNELYDAQEDADFYKEAYRLSEMRTAPFYGARMGGFMLCTLDGIRIDEYMRPIDADHNPFEGIYVIGDCSGGYYSGTYPNLFTGHACGRTLTYARRVTHILTGDITIE